MEDETRWDSLRRLSGRSAGVDAAVKDAAAEEFRDLERSARPFLLTDVVGPDFAAWWRGEVLKTLGKEQVYFIAGDGPTGQRRLMEGEFETFAEECKTLSDRTQYAYMQTEMLLEKGPALVQDLFRNMPGFLPTGEDNLFSLWPLGLSPPTLSLTVAGPGTRTQLICDGFEATQWILCLGGRMRLKLMPDDRARLWPLEPVSEAFGIRDEKGDPLFDVCAHLTSEVDLFAAELKDITPVTYVDSYGPDLQRWPEAKHLPRALEALLMPGEALLVPGGWWMQWYFDEPAWVASSQYLTASNLDHVLNTVLEHCGVEPASIFCLGELPPAQRIDSALAAALTTHGKGEGRVVLSKLRQLDSRREEMQESQRQEKASSQEQLAEEAPTKDSASSGKAPACDVCGRPATTRCGRCKDFWLCGAECQRRSWPEHKKVCVRAR